jgi:hypothetical protein
MASRQTLSEDEDEEVPLAVPLQSDTTPFTSRTETNAASPAHDIDAVRSITPPLPPVPVLLLTGYLGAGKTTLVNYILTAKHGYRCAVLLNEIADSADVEKALVREPEVRCPLYRATTKIPNLFSFLQLVTLLDHRHEHSLLCFRFISHYATY